VDGEWRHHQWQWIVYGAEFSGICDCDRDEYAGLDQVGENRDHGGGANGSADDFFCRSGVQPIDNCHECDVAMHGDGSGDGKFQLDSDVDSEWRHDQ
jgi:hypothetical protein